MTTDLHDRPTTLVVLTYERTEALSALLPLLEAQISENGLEQAEILVVDNNPADSARTVVEADQSGLVRYVHEPSPGIAHARNRAFDETTAADLLVFIDDDEAPLDGWLRAMLVTYADSGAAAVTGPVYPDYETAPEDWILAGGFFVRKEFPDGTLMPAASTGNLLLDLAQVREMGLRFDLRFGTTGGSDTFFTRQLVEHGGRIVWSQGAALVDKVPAKRLTRAWVLNRFYRVGNTWSRTSVALVDEPWRRTLSRLDMSARGLARILYGAVRGTWGRLSSSAVHDARGQRAVHRGRGMVAGAWGSAYEEYRRPVEANA